MLPYRNITLDDVINEVVIRMNDQRSGVNVDWATLRRMTNRSIKEVVNMTLPYKSWAYTSRIAVTNGTVLPVTLIKPIRVLLSASGNPPYREAREVDIREMYSITDGSKQHSWNLDLTIDPVYLFWGDNSITPTNFVIYVSPAGYSGILEGHFIPGDLAAPTDVVPIPYEFAELAVLGVIARVYQKFQEGNALASVLQRVVEERQRILSKFVEKRRAEEKDLEAFEEEANPIFIVKKDKGG